MRIGIIGTGNMGQALGLRWAATGHEVLFGSRDDGKGEALASRAGAPARAGDFDAAAAFGEVVLYTVRDVLPSKLLSRPESLAGKIVIDCNNSDVPANFRFPPPIPSLAEELATDVPKTRVVKAFNTMASRVIEIDREHLEPQRISVFLCADDADAKRTARALAEQLGFRAVDCGELEGARMVEQLGDFIRFQILGMGLGFLATISVHVLPEAFE